MTMTTAQTTNLAVAVSLLSDQMRRSCRSPGAAYNNDSQSTTSARWELREEQLGEDMSLSDTAISEPIVSGRVVLETSGKQ